MSGFPIPENHNHWWLTTATAWNRLHAVPGGSLSYDEHRKAIDDCEPCTRTTACGRTLRLTYAGLFSRFGMPRCAHCCQALGIPAGPGTPVNEAYEKRLAAGKAQEGSQ